MSYRRSLEMSPEHVIRRMKSLCHADLSFFRMTQMSFLPPKDNGVFCVSARNRLYFSLHAQQTFGFNASKRHFVIRLSGDESRTVLTGRFHFSDCLVYFLAAILFSLAAGTRSLLERPQHLVLFVVGFLGIWALQCLIGMLVFREEEKLLLETIDVLLAQIARETR